MTFLRQSRSGQETLKQRAHDRARANASQTQMLFYGGSEAFSRDVFSHPLSDLGLATSLAISRRGNTRR